MYRQRLDGAGAASGYKFREDGNSLASLPLRAAAADTIIVLDPHPLICLSAILRRRLRYRGGQHADGVFDRITPAFLWYVNRYRRQHLPRVFACIAEHGHNADVIHLTSRAQQRAWLAQHTSSSTGPA